jgi:probable F420-dependent oxidoreductase
MSIDTTDNSPTVSTGEPQLSVGMVNWSADDPGSWEPFLQRAEIADAAGIDRIAVSDHIVFGERLEEYGRPEIGGQKGGTQPTGPDGHWLEPLTTLSVIAGRTRRVRLATGILEAALRRPAVLAKATSTLDVLSRGRLDLGVGVGWQREEYEAAGLDFDARGRQLDHTLEVLQTLWGQQRASYHSVELDFDAIHQMPKPLQDGGVPVWVSGTINPRTVSRLARFGVGWIPWNDEAMDIVNAIPRMREALIAAGRDDVEAVAVMGYLPVMFTDDGTLDAGRTMDFVLPMLSAGVTDFRAFLQLPTDPNQARDLLYPLVEAFRKTVGRAPR